MCQEYGMGSSLLPAKDESTLMLENLYKECKTLLLSMHTTLESIESILLERESISKSDVKKLLDEVL